MVGGNRNTLLTCVNDRCCVERRPASEDRGGNAIIAIQQYTFTDNQEIRGYRLLPLLKELLLVKRETAIVQFQTA